MKQTARSKLITVLIMCLVLVLGAGIGICCGYNLNDRDKSGVADAGNTEGTGTDKETDNDPAAGSGQIPGNDPDTANGQDAAGNDPGGTSSTDLLGPDEETPKQYRMKAEMISDIPEGGMQLEAVFPDWKGYTDDTLAMNSMIGFEGWHGQGYLYMSLGENTESLRVFVNGYEADTTELTGGGNCRIDFSEVAKDGKNTLQITEIAPNDLKEAVRVYIPYPVVLDGDFEDCGIRPEALKLVEDIISSDVEYGFPGAQLAIVRHGRLVYENAWGKTNAYLPDGSPNGESAPVTTETLYDLASVTKMFSVNYALQKLLTEERYSLDDRISKYLGDRFWQDVIDIDYDGGANPGLKTQKAWKSEITIRDLLYHQAGFPSGINYQKRYYNVRKLKNDPDTENILYAGADGDEKTKAATVEAICKTPLYYEPRTKTKYSDIDYVILGLIVENITGTDLNSYLKENFWDPMGLKHITYRPLDNGFTKEDCAATELNGNTRDGAVDFSGVRKQTVWGQVHDEMAWYSMGGISGHAGLFANASDLARLASAMLTGGYGENRFFSRNVIDLFTSPQNIEFGQWAMGWWRNGDKQRPWYYGSTADSDVIGHQGWTGTLAVIDPANDLVIVYLTNKINTPVTDRITNSNKFDGNWYTASTLGFVAQILTIGMDEDNDIMPQLRSLAADMVNESNKLVPKKAAAEHPAVKNAESKAAVLKNWID